MMYIPTAVGEMFPVLFHFTERVEGSGGFPTTVTAVFLISNALLLHDIYTKNASSVLRLMLSVLDISLLMYVALLPFSQRVQGIHIIIIVDGTSS